MLLATEALAIEASLFALALGERPSFAFATFGSLAFGFAFGVVGVVVVVVRVVVVVDS